MARIAEIVAMPHLHSSADSVIVISLNLRFGLADDGPNAWTHRKSAIAVLLRRQPADFYCFQEANDFQISEIQALLPRHAVIGQRVPAPPFWQNNVIFHNQSFRCIDRLHFFLSPTPSIPSRFRDSRWPRQCSVGTFRREGRTLVCATTHLDFDSAVQRRSAAIILEHLPDRQKNIPVILAGDFNAAPQSDCYRVFENAGFKKADAISRCGTYHGFTGKSKGDCIDWILYRGGLRELNTAILRERYDGRYPSDHFPVRAELGFSKDS